MISKADDESSLSTKTQHLCSVHAPLSSVHTMLGAAWQNAASHRHLTRRPLELWSEEVGLLRLLWLPLLLV